MVSVSLWQLFCWMTSLECAKLFLYFWWQVIDDFDQNVHFVEIDIEEDQEIAEAAGIMGTPCVQFFKNKEMLRFVISFPFILLLLLPLRGCSWIWFICSLGLLVLASWLYAQVCYVIFLFISDLILLFRMVVGSWQPLIIPVLNMQDCVGRENEERVPRVHWRK